MGNTKEKILHTALRLFARDGYEAVSVSAIAGELGMTKSALYKHYENKQDIFDSIVRRMEQKDSEQAKRFELPEELKKDNEQSCVVTLEQLITFCRAQFEYWTLDGFSSDFRRMLTIEQYRSREMQQLYQQYLASGPVEYTRELFIGMMTDETAAERLALELYAQMFLLYSVYDGADDKQPVLDTLNAHLERFARNFENERVN